MSAARKSGRTEAAMPIVPLGEQAGRQAHVGVVPGAEAPLIAVELPARVRGTQRERIAERHLRDSMGLDPALVELRPMRDPAHPQAWSRLLIADRSRISQWRAEAGEGCRMALPDFLTLSTAKGLWTLDHREGQLLARLGPFDGFSAEPDLARVVLGRKIAEDPPKAILWSGPPLPELDALWQDRDIPVLSNSEEVAALGLPSPARLAHGEESVDLLQDPQQDRDRLARAVLPWRWPMLVALLAVGVWVAALSIETQRLRELTRETRAEASRIARADLIPDGPILDLRLQIGNRLDQLRAGAQSQESADAPLLLASRAIMVLHGNSLKTESIEFSRAEGLLVVAKVADFAAQDVLVSRLKAAGLSVELIESGLGDAGTGVRVSVLLGMAEQGE